LIQNGRYALSENPNNREHQNETRLQAGSDIENLTRAEASMSGGGLPQADGDAVVEFQDSSEIGIATSQAKQTAALEPFAIVKSFLRIGYGTAFLGLVLVFWTSFLSRSSFYCELLSHFRWQYLFVGVTLLVTSRWLASRGVAIAVLLLTLPHAWQVFPYYLPPLWLVSAMEIRSTDQGFASDSNLNIDPSTVAIKDQPKVLRLLSFNVFVASQQYQQTIDYVRELDPDFFVVIECSIPWDRALRRGLADRYPYTAQDALPGWYGNQVFSKYPLKAATDYPDFDAALESNKIMAVSSIWQGQPIYIAAVHPNSPEAPDELIFRNQEMDLIAGVAAGLSSPAIFAGDYNCSSGSPFFSDFLQKSRLRDSRIGFGWQGSWPSFVWPLQIPIDHVLVSEHWDVNYRSIGPNLGSDHLPVVIELQLKSGGD